MRSLLFCPLYAVVGLAACGGDDRPRGLGSSGAANHPAVIVDGGDGNSGGDAAGGELDTGGDTHAGGAGGAAGERATPPLVGLGGEPSVAEPVCDPRGSFGEPEPQLVAGASGLQLLSVALDEKSVAYVEGEGEAAVLFVADRADAEDPFDAGAAVALPAGYDLESGASLSADGLSLVLVKSDHSGFGLLSRVSSTAPFASEADEALFVDLNSLKPTTGNSLGWPLLSRDGMTLYFVSYQLESRVLQAERTDAGPFRFGMVIDEDALGGEAGGFKLLTGIASDQRAIFFFDQATGRSSARFRSRPQAPFYDEVDLGERSGLGPNAECTRVYSSAAGALFRQSRE